MSLYFGDVSLCYTNSLAVALDSFGFDVRPERLEALMVIGNGASVVEDDPHIRSSSSTTGCPTRPSVTACAF